MVRKTDPNHLANVLDTLTRSFGPVKERHPWSKQDDETLEECLPDLVEAARRLGRPFIAVQSRAYQLGHHKTHTLSMTVLKNRYAAEIAGLGPIDPRPPKFKRLTEKAADSVYTPHIIKDDNALLCPCGQDKSAPLGEHAEWCDKRRAPTTPITIPGTKGAEPIVVREVAATLSDPTTLEPNSLELHIANVQAAKALYLETKADLLKFVEGL